MTISFLLHSGIRKPSGGVKIILDYANALAEKGHTVFIVQPCFLSKKTSCSNALRRYIYYKFTKKYEPTWFKVNENVHGKLVWSLEEKNVPVSDVYIATYVETAFWLNEYKNIAKKFYFIQGFEDWNVEKDKVINSYSLNLKKIVVSDWLGEIVKQQGEEFSLIQNGFDTSVFFIKKHNEISCKKILFMWHEDEIKRCSDTIKAISLVKKQIPDLQVSIFSSFPDPHIKDFEYTFFYKASQEILALLYNESYVYVAASRDEGWGLTIGEAMLCGCSVVCTNNRGFKIMAENEVTALVSPVFDYKLLAENIIRVLKDKGLHDKLVKNAYEKIQKFSIEESRNQFVKIVTK